MKKRKKNGRYLLEISALLDGIKNLYVVVL